MEEGREGIWSEIIHLEQKLVLWIQSAVFGQRKDIIQWRPARTDSVPNEQNTEIVLFLPFLEHGLALPAYDFLQGLLNYYGIQIQHLDPKSIL